MKNTNKQDLSALIVLTRFYSRLLRKEKNKEYISNKMDAYYFGTKG